ncbi:MAG: hypothetical protein JOS17DRAFT_771801 [Linnemannia elongata]|nr:MAG: hypothetical protein JOS17DRAFT_771801 [Linnemannia elongata]
MAVNEARHPFRTFTETRPAYRESLTCTANLYTIQPLDHAQDEALLKPANGNNNNTHPHITQLPSSSPTPEISTTGKKVSARTCPEVRRIRWTEEEDREFFQLVKEGKKPFFIHSNYFRHRSRRAVAHRADLAYKAASLQKRQAKDGVRDGEPDVARSAAGDEGAEPLRVVYGKIVRMLREASRVRDKLEGRIPRPVAYDEKYLSHNKMWSLEEDELLRQLVQKFSDIPPPHLWHEVSCGSIDGSKRLLRAPIRCNLRWRQLYPFPSSRTGSWSKQEELRLQEAISEQLEGKYQVAIDILAENYAKKAKRQTTILFTTCIDVNESMISREVIFCNAIKRAKTRRGKWTPEEDLLLEKLVDKYHDLPEPTIWNTISGRSIGDSAPLLRTGSSCCRRWIRLHPSPLRQTGRWTKDEDLRLQEAIWDQLEGKYQVAVDVLVGKPATNELNLDQWPPQLKQLPSHSQAGLPLLKVASRRLGMLNWLLIGEKVGTRSDFECRSHFYYLYHNGNRGPWSEEELRRLEEGQEMFGKDYWKIAEHVGTRGPRQATDMVCLLERRKKSQKAKKEKSDTQLRCYQIQTGPGALNSDNKGPQTKVQTLMIL